MQPLDAFVRVAFLGFAAILAAVCLKSYARHRERRFLLLSAAFSLFLVEGAFLVAEMLMSLSSSVGTEWVTLNLAILVSLYLALLR